MGKFTKIKKFFEDAFGFIHSTFLNNNTYAVEDVYGNFNELKSEQLEGVDYVIDSINRDSQTCIIAIHGGSIEIGTTEFAKSLSTLGNYNCYSFIGIKPSNNSVLHITATNFDEPIALDMVKNSRITLSIHGCKGNDKFTYLGGLDTELGKKIKVSLEKHGFKVLLGKEGLDGSSEYNIVNKNILGKGVQLEISRGLRNYFITNTTNVPTKELTEYTFALYGAIEEYINR